MGEDLLWRGVFGSSDVAIFYILNLVAVSCLILDESIVFSSINERISRWSKWTWMPFLLKEHQFGARTDG